MKTTAIVVGLLLLAGCRSDQGAGQVEPPPKTIAVTAESIGGQWKCGKMIMELREDGKAVVQDTQTVWPLDQPEKKEDITTTYKGTWKLPGESVVEITFPEDGAPPRFRGGRYQTSLEEHKMTMSRLDGATILDGPAWIRP